MTNEQITETLAATVQETIRETLQDAVKLAGTLNVNLTITFAAPLVVQTEDAPAGPPTRLRITLGEAPMPHTITVDTTNETATVEFTDDKGNVLTDLPSGFGSIAFTTSDESVLTVAADPSNALQGDLTPVGVPGSGITVTAQPLDAGGNPLLEADGATPFPAATSDALDVTPGAATGEQITLAPQ